MAVPVVATSATSKEETGTTLTLDVTMPSGVSSGDVLYVIITSDSGTATYATPVGWGNEGDVLSSTAGCGMYLFSRRADGTEAASYTFTCSNNRYKNAVALRVTGVDTGVTDLTHQYAELDDTGTGTAHTSPPVTTSEADCLVLSAFCADNTGVDSMAPAGSETEVADIQNAGFNGMVLAVYRTDKATAGAVDHDVTFSPSGAACVSMTWAVEEGAPIGGGGGAGGLMMLGNG